MTISSPSFFPKSSTGNPEVALRFGEFHSPAGVPFVFSYSRVGMRRLLAITMSLLFGLTLAAPLLTFSSLSNIRECCRRSGRHQCMAGMTASTERSFSGIASQCPNWPRAIAVPFPHSFTPAVASSTDAPLFTHPSASPQTEARYRIAFRTQSAKTRTSYLPPLAFQFFFAENCQYHALKATCATPWARRLRCLYASSYGCFRFYFCSPFTPLMVVSSARSRGSSTIRSTGPFRALLSCSKAIHRPFTQTLTTDRDGSFRFQTVPFG